MKAAQQSSESKMRQLHKDSGSVTGFSGTPSFDDFDITSSWTKEEIIRIARETEIDLSTPLPKPPLALSVHLDTLFYLGDISMTIGKAKSRKTFSGSLLMSVLVANSSNGCLKATLPDDKRVVLSFDTEQGSYHAQMAANRVLRLLGVDKTPYFKAFGLRKHSPSERLEIIEHLIYNTPNLGVVFIDGIRDLITSINDEEQATIITSKLLKWSEELNIHINCVLHMNKGDQNARGHVGTEMLNKSLTVISVSIDKYNPQCSNFEVVQSRDKQPLPFTFGINDDILPYILPDSEVEALITKPRDKKSINPSDFGLEVHGDKLKKILGDTKQLNYGQLLASVQNNYEIGENKAKNFIAYFGQEKLLLKEKDGNKTMYSLV